ncbi:hypothetical protein QL285_058604 [Trifolium repens]|jgi:hypothetical protein|nr:hypothetical protein QL285_058604 [Trifolium repens]
MDYENLPQFCTHCNMVGHYIEVCKWVQGKEDVAQQKEPKNVAKQKNEVTKKYVQSKDGRVQQNKLPEIVNVEGSSSKSINKITHEAPVENMVTVIERIENVSTPVNSKEISISAEKSGAATQNRFLVLDEQLGVIPPDADDEIMENVDDDNSNTPDSEFVDATQLQQLDDTNKVQEHDTSLDMAHKNMQFLKESWANMAENEEDEIRLLEALQKEPSPSGFKMVTSKSSNKMKAKGNKTSGNGSSYGTRSKVSQAKPFK